MRSSFPPLILMMSFMLFLGCGGGAVAPDGEVPDLEGESPHLEEGAADEGRFSEFEPTDETVGAEVAAPTQLAYVLVPHPDDEYGGWALIGNTPSDYKVFILLTQGEETTYCRAASEGSGGPQGYEGPGSPVGRPDLNEAHPTPTPWVGRFTAACRQARVNSFHSFLDDMGKSDKGLPVAPSFRGNFCFPGAPMDGPAPSAVDNGVSKEARCADVWSDARGARVVFNLGDGDLRSAEVSWALEVVRRARSKLGIPLLPEQRVVGASYYNARYDGCPRYTHPDHRAVHESLWKWSHGAGPQYGRTCDSDPDIVATGGKRYLVRESTQAKTFEMNGDKRVGPFVRHYGWLNPAWTPPPAVGSVYSKNQSFWVRH